MLNDDWSQNGGTGWISPWSNGVQTTTEEIFPAGGGVAAGRMLANEGQRTFWQNGNPANVVSANATFYLRTSIFLDPGLPPSNQEYWRRSGGYGLGSHNQGPEVGFSTSEFGGGQGSATEGQWWFSNGSGGKSGLVSEITSTPFLSKFSTWYTVDMTINKTGSIYDYDVAVYEHDSSGAIVDSASATDIAVGQNLFNNGQQGTFFFRGSAYAQNGSVLYFDEMTISNNPLGAPIPEPATGAVLVAAGLFLVNRRRRC